MTGQDIPENESGADAAEYVLRLLPEEEIAAFEARLADDTALRGEVAFWEVRLTSLLDDLPEVAPRPELKQRIANSVDRNTPKVPANQAGWWRGISAIAATVIIGLSIQLYQTSRPAPFGELLVSPVSGDSVMVHVAYDPARQGMRVRPIVGPTVDNEVMELWAIPPDAAPVSLGVVPADETSLVHLPDELVSVFAQVTLALSLEPPGGSPTGAPSGPVVATGTLGAY